MPDEYVEKLKANTALKQEYLKYFEKQKSKKLAAEPFGNWMKSHGKSLGYKEPQSEPTESYGGIEKEAKTATGKVGKELRRALE